ncbi:MAG: hypothetical protein U9R37_07940 [Campylobacterota bacterium]|nr:hypothetical protein [Campylobacterota bacterium]
MIKILVLLLPIYIFAAVNPYTTLSTNEKLEVVINYFINEELKTKLPPKPIKEILKDDGANMDPVKYERYFNYVQRLKAIRESRAAEQKNIDERYLGKIGFYNAKLKKLKKFYTKKENIYPIINNSINKGFKIIFGQPMIKDMVHYQGSDTVIVNLTASDIYRLDKFKNRRVKIYIYPYKVENLLQNYLKSNTIVNFKYDGTYLVAQDISVFYEDEEFIGNFMEKELFKIKLDIKINDDIFTPLLVNNKLDK